MFTAHPSRLFLVTFIITAILQSPLPAISQTNDLQPLVAGNTAFALDLYSRMKASDGNLFFSPYSISTCLAMTYAGARGNTEKQIAQVLHFGESQDQLPSSFRALQNQLDEAQKTKNVGLDIANGLWMEKHHPFLPAFQKIARNDYDANLVQADFLKGAEPVRQKINGWVSQKTKGKITELIPLGMLDQKARLVLVNAIYFKGAWSSPFKTNQTTTQPFHISKNRWVKAQLMHQVKQAGYFENNDFQLVQLPYTDAQLSMVVILPRHAALGKIESALNPQSLAQYLGEMQNQEVEIFLPKFRMEIGFELGLTLAKLGIPDAFGTAANFSGIDGTRQLHISSIMHKAFVEVNEQGTEAAAASGARLTLLGPHSTPPVFRADHPFIFLIRDNRSGTILFLGRVIDPTPADNQKL